MKLQLFPNHLKSGECNHGTDSQGGQNIMWQVTDGESDSDFHAKPSS